MKQDNSIHVFHSLKDMALGLLIGAMLYYIIDTSSCVTPVAEPRPSIQNETGVRSLSPTPVSIASPTPESEDQ
jgi:hypothetical protein